MNTITHTPHIHFIYILLLYSHSAVAAHFSGSHASSSPSSRRRRETRKLFYMLWWHWRRNRTFPKMMRSGAIVEERYVYEEETHLTVHKTSLFFPGDGFTTYDSSGKLVFRVDSYGPDAGDSGEVVLMDAVGGCILTVHRKRPSLHNRWEGFVGEGVEGKKPLFSVRRSSIIGRSGVSVEVYTDPNEEYQIEGSFACRKCTIYNADKESVAEIRRKVDPTTNVILGKDVFVLSLSGGFDGAFAMGLVLVLDQIQGAEEEAEADARGSGRVGVDPTEGCTLFGVE